MDRTVALVTLGCARNDVDSEELAGRLVEQGWRVVDDPDGADAVLVNTCGFVDVAKKDSIDTLLAAAQLRDDGGAQAVIAVGCLADRYGGSLGQELPEVDAVLSFDDYPEIHDRLERVLAGETLPAHIPKDRRLSISPIERQPTGWTPPVLRHRLVDSPVAPVKLASGCDRRCTFCAIPRFRGSFVSRTPDAVIAEIEMLSQSGVREVVLVSENSTSYGKDLGDIRALEKLLTQLDERSAVDRIRVAYLQPAEIRPDLIAVIAQGTRVCSSFDISFQHASPTLLRRMRRFGGRDDFLDLIRQIRELAPTAGLRSNVIVGFPGETDEDVDTLIDFLEQARLDAIGVFAYSDEEDTEAFTFEDKVPAEVISQRTTLIRDLADQLMADRAAERVGEASRVLVEALDDDEELGPVAIGRATHQNPDDGATLLPIQGQPPAIGDFLEVHFVASRGVDLVGKY
jgi:ribosomal protein S12 methylthiotransferase RimO